MTVALQSPKLAKALVSVDNAPIDANLKSNFHQYVRGLREVEERRVRRQADADEVLASYEKVSRYINVGPESCHCLTNTQHLGNRN